MLTKRDKTKLYRKIKNKGCKEICQANTNQKHLMLISDQILKTKRYNNHLYAWNKEPLNPETCGRLRLSGWVRSCLRSVLSHCRELQDLITQNSLNMYWSAGYRGFAEHWVYAEGEDAAAHWRAYSLLGKETSSLLPHRDAMTAQTHSRCSGNTWRDS